MDEIGLRFSDIHGLGNGLDPTNHRLRYKLLISVVNHDAAM